MYAHKDPQPDVAVSVKYQIKYNYSFILRNVALREHFNNTKLKTNLLERKIAALFLLFCLGRSANVILAWPQERKWAKTARLALNDGRFKRQIVTTR